MFSDEQVEAALLAFFRYAPGTQFAEPGKENMRRALAASLRQEATAQQAAQDDRDGAVLQKANPEHKAFYDHGFAAGIEAAAQHARRMGAGKAIYNAILALQPPAAESEKPNVLD